MRTSISSLASSFPGHACTPCPNGRNVLGRGATCIIRNVLSVTSYVPQQLTAVRPMLLYVTYLESRRVELVWILEVVRAVVDVPEERHHLPPLGDKEPYTYAKEGDRYME